MTTEEIDQKIADLRSESDELYKSERKRWEIDDSINDLLRRRMTLTHPELQAEWDEINNSYESLQKRGRELAEKIRGAGLKFQPFDHR